MRQIFKKFAFQIIHKMIKVTPPSQKIQFSAKFATRFEGRLWYMGGVISGGVTGEFGWVQTHPLSKKAPMRFFANPKNFWGVGG